MVSKRLGILIIVALLLCPAASVHAASNASEYRLKGLLASSSGRSALINGRVVRQGDRLGPVEIVAIEDASVVLRTDGREHVLRLGSSFRPGATAPDGSAVRVASGHAAGPPVSEAIEPVRAPEPHVAGRHTVLQGETLFGIAREHYGEAGSHDATRGPDRGGRDAVGSIATDRIHRAMLALYETNPDAFGGSMNLVYAGATLRLPDRETLHRVDATRASTEVARHVERWRRSAPETRSAPTRAIGTPLYGPVVAGETLGEIAASLRPRDISLDQMMMAVYDANPDAFAGNINWLHEGSVLTIPDPGGFTARGAELASARVLRHVDRWHDDRAGSTRIARVEGVEGRHASELDVVSLTAGL